MHTVRTMFGLDSVRLADDQLVHRFGGGGLISYSRNFSKEL